MQIVRKSRQLWRWAKGRDPLCFEDVRLDSVVLGSEYGGHSVFPHGLSRDSVAYSLGVGEDVSFDTALIERCGVELHAFDPTPRSMQWVRRQTLPSRFRFHPIGVADYDGVGSFNPPKNPAHVSHTLTARPETAERALKVEVRRLTTLLETLGHQKLDILKMDIEGSEYEVLEQMLDENLHVDQVLVEYHHQFRSIPRSRTAESVAKLRQAGYSVFHISETGREYSLIHERLLKN
jgi:FkbM family methyltransferase